MQAVEPQASRLMPATSSEILLNYSPASLMLVVFVDDDVFVFLLVCGAIVTGWIADAFLLGMSGSRFEILINRAKK